MRTGILTFPNSISYGAVLQMYALQHTIQKLGYDVEVINYYNAYMKAEQHTQKGSLKSAASLLVRKKLRELLHHRLYTSFKRFEKEYIHLYPQKYFSDRQKLKEIGKRYDAVVCGSDQVWNPDITDSDNSYFLDFCGAQTRRISFAPSFGIQEFSMAFCNAVIPELEKFSAISVREEVGQAMIRQHLGREVPVVMDPTLLVDAAEWTALEKPYKVDAEKYILYYTVRRSEPLFRFCRELAAKNGMKVVAVGGNFLKKMNSRDENVEYAVDISPEQWLYLVHHAECIVTNSFHGTAFSINYRKDFYVELSSFTNSRLEQIVKTLGLENQIVQDGAAAELPHIDYRAVENRLPELCSNSAAYLKNALQEDSVHG